MGRGRWVPLTWGWARDGRQVVAVEGDVEDADGDLLPLHALDLGGDALGERHAAGADADEQQSATPPLRSTISTAIRRMIRAICLASRIVLFGVRFLCMCSGVLRVRGIAMAGGGGCQ